ncbi:GGDEF domain-containing protein [Rhodalgimonas zhirmunskyi]|uniref:diguanylate cyclase n=1 Tax=Rhodalgimonas zhirmunskyi TaxID=2964767 RepID=A0AAJ1U8A0_9RHOB|nr:GGDEF domain-containing protein [Rhodoalgimonas zhirmunskyi]MDQ2095176.1 GGDEF domain-containing protein [Rhodoalgimonas zhirmunskyi]
MSVYAASIAAIAVGLSLGIEYLLLDADLFGAYWTNVALVAGIVAFILSVVTIWSFRRLLGSWRMLRHASTHDFLTGAGNRAFFFDVLAKREGQRRGAKVTLQDGAVLIACDLDDFKQVNDRIGHLGGDEILLEVVRRFRSALPDTAAITRFGGDEFMLYVPASVFADRHAEQRTIDQLAFDQAETVRRSVADTPFMTARGTMNVRLSIGLAASRDGQSLEDLLRLADDALYAAKRAGGDRVVSCLGEGVDLPTRQKREFNTF